MAQQPTQPRIGVSACLLGNLVRFDGGHKRSPFVHSVLGRFAALLRRLSRQRYFEPYPRALGAETGA